MNFVKETFLSGLLAAATLTQAFGQNKTNLTLASELQPIDGTMISIESSVKNSSSDIDHGVTTIHLHRPSNLDPVRAQSVTLYATDGANGEPKNGIITAKEIVGFGALFINDTGDRDMVTGKADGVGYKVDRELMNGADSQNAGLSKFYRDSFFTENLGDVKLLRNIISKLPRSEPKR